MVLDHRRVRSVRLVVLLLSPDAAESPWVNNEVEYWLAKKDPDRIIPVLTAGEFGWSNADVAGDAVPPSLLGAFSDEPRWVDLRFARTEEQLDLGNPTFSAAIADIASAIRGVPKDELESEEVRQHRRTVRTAWAAGIVVFLLAVGATIAAVVAVSEQQRANDEAERANEAVAAEEAQRQVAEDERDTAQQERDRADAQALIARENERNARSEALAANAIAQLDTDPELSMLLALEAMTVAEQPTAVNVLHGSLAAHRTLATLSLSREFQFFAANPDGSLVALRTFDEPEIELWDVASEELVWSVDPVPGAELFIGSMWFSDDGSFLVVLDSGLVDGDSEGLLVVDITDGVVVRTYDLGDCPIDMHPGYGQFVDLEGHVTVEWGVPVEGGSFACDGTIRPSGTLDMATGDTAVFAEVEATFNGLGGATLSEDAARFAVGILSPVVVHDTASGTLIREFEQGGVSTLSADGETILVGTNPVQLRAIDSGELLATYPGNANDAFFSPDERQILIATVEGPVLVFDTSTGDLINELLGASMWSSNVSVTNDQGRVFTDSREAVRLWDLGPLIESEAPNLDLPEGVLTGNALSSLTIAGDLVVVPYLSVDESGFEGVRYRVFGTDGTLIRESGIVGMYAVSADGRYIAQEQWGPALHPETGEQGSRSTGFELVDARTGEAVRLFEWCPYWISDATGDLEADPDCPEYVQAFDAEFSQDGSRLAVVGFKWNAVVHDVNTGQAVWRSPRVTDSGDFGHQIALSHDGSTVLWLESTTDGYTATDISSGQRLAALGNPASAAEIAFHPVENYAFIGHHGGQLVVLDTAEWETRSILARSQSGDIADIGISPDGATVAAGHWDGRFRVWDWRNERLLIDLELGVPIRHVTYFDQDHVLVMSRTGDAVMITLDNDELMDLAANRVTRSFTDEECSTYGIDPCPTLEAIRST